MSFAIFIFGYYKLMDDPHFYIAKVHTITIMSSSSFGHIIEEYFYDVDGIRPWIFSILTLLITYSPNNIPTFDPIFLNFVFPFRWLKNEFKEIFHDPLNFLKEYVPLLLTSLIDSSASSIHVIFLLIVRISFNCGVNLMVFYSSARGTFSLFITCKSKLEFMISWFLFVPTSLGCHSLYNF